MHEIHLLYFSVRSNEDSVVSSQLMLSSPFKYLKHFSADLATYSLKLPKLAYEVW